MTKFSLEIAKIVGTASAKNWSQVHTFLPEKPEKISRRGQLLAVIGLSGAVEEISAVGKEVISRLHEEYYGDLIAEPFVQLKKALIKVKNELGEGAVLDIEAAAVIGRFLYLAIAGEGQIVLQRNNKIGTILQGGEEIVTASGHLQNKDLFLLATPEFFKLATKRVLESALTTGSANEAAAILIPLIHSQEDGKIAAAVITGVKEETIVVEKKEPAVKNLSFQGWKKNFGRFTFMVGRSLGRQLFFFKNRLFSLFQKVEESQKPQKTMITVALILLLILGISVVFGMRQRKSLTQEKQINVLLAEARAKKEEGETFVTLNPQRARELLLEAQKVVQKIPPDLATNQIVVKFKQELETALAKVWREHQVQPTVFFDLGLIKDRARGDDVDFSGGQMIILDKANSSLYSLSIANKKSAILGGGEKFNSASQVAAFVPKVFVLTEDGILQTEIGTSQQNLVIATDKDWGEIGEARVFQGSLYLLDRKEKIWKYAGGETGFSSKQEWLKEKADFSQAVSMAIDGSIWVLKSDGTVFKYTRGLKETFGIAGLSKPFSNPTAIYTDSDQEHLYILDKGNSRVVVLAKSGEYDSEYVFPAQINVSKLVVSEKDKKIFLLAGSKIYAIEMQL